VDGRGRGHVPEKIRAAWERKDTEKRGGGGECRGGGWTARRNGNRVMRRGEEEDEKQGGGAIPNAHEGMDSRGGGKRSKNGEMKNSDRAREKRGFRGRG